MQQAALTLEQQRAQHALKCVRALRDERDDGFKKRYLSYVERLGPAIVMNGLGQALATERAAAGKNPIKTEEQAHLTLYENLQQWLCRSDGGVYPDGTDLLDEITKHDEAYYLRAQAEALAWLEWHKKFCRAEFPKDASQD